MTINNHPLSLSTDADTITSQSSSLPPEGFSILTDIVTEEAWEEIRNYLGLRVTIISADDDDDANKNTPHRQDNNSIYIKIHGVDDEDENDGDGDGDGDGDDGDGDNQDDDDDDGSNKSMTTTTIPWESTPFPQNRPVAQFGFRYDYERDAVVTTVVDDDDNKHKNNEAVPKIPDLFQRLLLRSYYRYDVDNYDDNDNNNKEDEDEEEIKTTKLKSSSNFTQCIVNVYRPTATTVESSQSPLNHQNTTTAKAKTTTSTTTTSSSSIPWHVDDPQFGPVIIVFTFGETRPLYMRLKHDNNNSSSNDDDDDGGDGDGDGADCYYRSYFTAHPPHRSCYVLSGAARHRWEHSVPPGSGWRVSITFRTLR